MLNSVLAGGDIRDEMSCPNSLCISKSTKIGLWSDSMIDPSDGIPVFVIAEVMSLLAKM